METNTAPLPFEDADWYSWDSEDHDGGWLLSYVDVLCVVLAMMVVLLGHLMAQRRHSLPTPAPVVHAAPVTTPAPVKPTVIAVPAPAPAPAKKPTVVTASAPAPAKPKPIARAIAAPIAVAVKPVVKAPKKIATPAPAPVLAVAPAVKPAPSPQERLIAEVRSRFAGQITAVRHDRGVSLQIADVILFDSARADLRPAARPVLQQLVETLRKLGKTAITVEGHTDNQPVTGGRFRNNWELGAARANAVVEFLIQAGFDPARLRSVSYADTRPVASNATAEGRAENRRVELRVEFTTPKTSAAKPESVLRQ